MSHKVAQASARHERVRRAARAMLIRHGAVAVSRRSWMSMVTTLAASWCDPGSPVACSRFILGRCVPSWDIAPRQLTPGSYPADSHHCEAGR